VAASCEHGNKLSGYKIGDWATISFSRTQVRRYVIINCTVHSTCLTDPNYFTIFYVIIMYCLSYITILLFFIFFLLHPLSSLNLFSSPYSSSLLSSSSSPPLKFYLLPVLNLLHDSVVG
jgi:hypothetical protein